MEGNLIS